MSAGAVGNQTKLSPDWFMMLGNRWKKESAGMYIPGYSRNDSGSFCKRNIVDVYACGCIRLEVGDKIVGEKECTCRRGRGIRQSWNPESFIQPGGLQDLP